MSIEALLKEIGMKETSGSSPRIAVITMCSSQKFADRGPAKVVYAASGKNIAGKIRIIAERFSADLWFLSAKYGLVHADEEIEAYDAYIKSVPLSHLKKAIKVIEEKSAKMPRYDAVVIAVSQPYLRLADHLKLRPRYVAAVAKRCPRWCPSCFLYRPRGYSDFPKGVEEFLKMFAKIISR
ncbi:MAG: DUF6884 domain-containing protein [Thermococcus sp.]